MGLGPGQGTAGRPTVRNAVMTMVIPFAVMFGGNILVSILASVTGVYQLAYAGQLFSLVGWVLWMVALWKMSKELDEITGTFKNWWFFLIPILNLYAILILLPQEMTKAKQMRGVQAPTRNLVVYFFFSLYAFAADLNDIAHAP